MGARFFPALRSNFTTQVNYIELPLGLVVIVASIMAQRLLLKIRAQYYSHNKMLKQTVTQDVESIMLSSLGSEPV